MQNSTFRFWPIPFILFLIAGCGGPSVFTGPNDADTGSPDYVNITGGSFNNGDYSYSQNYILSGTIVTFKNSKINSGNYESLNAQIVQTTSALGE